MPRKTDHQQEAGALLEALVINLLVEAETGAFRDVLDQTRTLTLMMIPLILI
jgi:hypothetical protein